MRPGRSLGPRPRPRALSFQCPPGRGGPPVTPETLLTTADPPPGRARSCQRHGTDVWMRPLLARSPP
eukprot:4217267-Alexandrium_andersonii.AAC.1